MTKIEKLYQKKIQLEHILLRPELYVGSIKNEEKVLWVFDSKTKTIVERKITYNPALYRIFDEILVNASDHKIRDKTMSEIKVDIDRDQNMISIWNNGKGIPVVLQKDVKKLVPTMLFGQLSTSTNFNDKNKQKTGGRNGYGAKLCNIFSTEFILETSCKEYKKSFRQIWTDNMSTYKTPVIEDNKIDDYTRVIFHPDLERFGMTHLDDDIVALFSRRAYDIAACTNGVTVFLDGQEIPVKNFKDYIELYTKSCGAKLNFVHEKYGDCWEVALTTSVNDNFTQVSFVNSIATTRGGTHVNYVTDEVANELLEIAKKKIKNDEQAVKLNTDQVKMNMWIFVKCIIQNPSFDSQTKENMILQANDFGSICKLSKDFISQAANNGIIEKFTRWTMLKHREFLDSHIKEFKLENIPTLDDAKFAGSKNSLKCTLILTKGDSSKKFALSCLENIDSQYRDYYGVFPLTGKLLNVREASTKQLSENVEITQLINILGLQYLETYYTAESMKTLRYRKLMIMYVDEEMSLIKGELINFFHSKWPNLLKHNFIEQFINPYATISKDEEEISFTNRQECFEWTIQATDSNKWKFKFFKKLHKVKKEDEKDYFSDMANHLIKFRCGGKEEGKSIDVDRELKQYAEVLRDVEEKEKSTKIIQSTVTTLTNATPLKKSNLIEKNNCKNRNNDHSKTRGNSQPRHNTTSKEKKQKDSEEKSDNADTAEKENITPQSGELPIIPESSF